MKVINPFAKGYNNVGIKTYPGNLINEYRNVQTYKKDKNLHNIVYKGIIISQTVGPISNKHIDDFLDKTTNHTKCKYWAYERKWEAYHEGIIERSKLKHKKS